jgi:hypothetical protein
MVTDFGRRCRRFGGRAPGLVPAVLSTGLALIVFSVLSAWGEAPRDPGTDSPGHSVRRTLCGEGTRLSFEWTDSSGSARAIDVLVPPAELEASEQALGFSLAELRQFLIEAEARIREEEGLSALDIARVVVDRISDPEWCRLSEDPSSEFNFIMTTDGAGRTGSEAEIRRILNAYQRRWEASRKTVCDRLQARLRRYAGDRGMEVTPRGIAVDYKRLVRDSAARLKPLAAEFKRAYGSSRGRLLEAVLSFVQNIPYRKTPAVDGGRYTAGVSVPLRILVDDCGDCDSKAVLFAALWSNISDGRTILVRVPEHMLAAVAAPFTPGEVLSLSSACYLLLELSCAEKLPAGKITPYSSSYIRSGIYKYKIVS